MLIWLASYPRSGNHLIRTILHNSFGLGSYEIYQARSQRPPEDEAAVIGALTYPDATPEAFLARARASRELFLVKTHDFVPQGDRVIYVVRDGRAATFSYQLYLEEVARTPTSLEEVVAGGVWPGPWADHVAHFLDRDPARTLILHYEDLASRTPPLDKLAAWLGVPVKQPFTVPFERMHALDPTRYARGNNHDGIAAISEKCAPLFWSRHGGAMRRAGYDVPDTAPTRHDKIFFWHVPKCAGSSMWSALRMIADGKPVFQHDRGDRVPDLYAMSATERDRYQVIGGHLPLNDWRQHIDLSHYFTVTTFREPTARLVSEYWYTLATPHHSQYAEVSRLSLEEYVLSRPNTICTLICGKPDPARAAATVAEVFDVWAFADDLDGLIACLFERAGRTRPTTPRLNVGPGSEPISEDLRALIERHNEADLELYRMLRAMEPRHGRVSRHVPSVHARTAAWPTFCIVTPTWNSEAYLDETIRSVVTQAGNFAVRYRIQDGGSTDRTLEIARSWQERLASAATATGAARVEMSIDSSPDRGMYDAIAKGFRALSPAPTDLMTWINSDDLLAPDALRTIAQAFAEMPDVSLAGGIPSPIDASGPRLPSAGLRAISRDAVAAGSHDGRLLPCLTQEGTFWRASLWHAAGGIDTRFRLAGDWDLWRRFCRHTDYVMLDAVTGHHRRRPGQLSEDMKSYHAEIDATLARKAGTTEPMYQNPGARIARRAETGIWMTARGLPAKPLKRAVSDTDGDWVTLAGFDHPEGPFPQFGLDQPLRWLTADSGVLAVFSEEAGVRDLCLLARNMARSQVVSIRVNEGPAFHVALGRKFNVEQRIRIPGPWQKGRNVVAIQPRKFVPSPDGRRLGICLYAAFFDERAPAPWIAFQRLLPARLRMGLPARDAS